MRWSIPGHCAQWSRTDSAEIHPVPMSSGPCCCQQQAGPSHCPNSTAQGPEQETEELQVEDFIES